MDDPPIPWIYVAMVAILFIRWVMGRFKAAAEKRSAIYQRRSAPESEPNVSDYELKRREDSRQSQIRGEEEERVRNQQQEARREQRRTTASGPPPMPHRTQQQPETAAAPQTLQELFEQRRQEIARAQRQAVAPPKPPPPEKPAEVSKPQVAIAPALPAISPIMVSPPLERVSRGERSKLVETFSDPTQVLNAVVLREVLGKPKGLEEE